MATESLVAQLWRLRLTREEYFAIINRDNPQKRLVMEPHTDCAILPWRLDSFVMRTSMPQHMVLLAFIVAALLFSEARMPGVFAAGFCLWPVYEYGLHKYALHVLPEKVLPGWRVVQVAHFMVHGYHHLRPSDTTHLMWPPAPVLLLFAAIFWSWAQLLGDGDVAANLTLGLMLGNFVYDCAHFLVHSPSGWEWLTDTALIRRLRRLHLKHHFKKPSPQPPYGVLHPWIDDLLEAASTTSAAAAAVPPQAR